MTSAKRPLNKPLLDASVIVIAGMLVSLAPAVWYPIAWPDQPSADGSLGDWLFLFAFTMIPFAIAALLRGVTALGRSSAAVATAAATALVVFGQYAGLNPNDPSSTAPIALVITPFWAAGLVIAVWAVELAAARFARRSAGCARP